MRTIRVLACALAACFTLSLSAQTVHKDWVDGQVHFIVDQKVPMNVPIKIVDGKTTFEYNPNDLGLDYFDWLEPIVTKYKGVKLSKPAHAAKTSNVLQRTYRLEFKDIQKVDDVVRALENLPEVEMAEKMPMCYLDYTPNDPLHNTSNMWGLYRVQADLAWNLWRGGATKAIVACTDNAFDIQHTDLSPTLWVNTVEQSGTPGIDDDGNGYIDDINGFDVSDNDAIVTPPTNGHDHGTHCMGTIGAKTDNSTGISSMGFDGVVNMAVKCARNTSSTSALPNGYDGIVYSAVNGAHIISCSWGGTGFSSYGQNVINYALGQGCIIVAAAGNSNSTANHYPAAYGGVIGVAATQGSDAKASFSNHGTYVDVAAPGTAIYSTLPNIGAPPSNLYGFKQGTSMATPMVSGLLGLMYSYNPGLPDSVLVNCLYNTCDPVTSHQSTMGNGRINANQAIQCIGNTLNNPPDAEFTANLTTITVGGSVNFTDLSAFAPSGWSWTFTGGTPGSSSVQHPQNIVYNTAGTYQVQLTATNSNGSNTETKTAYIQVNNSTGCDEITNVSWPADSGNYFTWGGAPNGYLGGTYGTGQTQWAELFDASAYTNATHLQQFRMAFARVGAGGPTSSFAVGMWDDNGTGGSPGTVLGAIGISLPALDAIIPDGQFAYITLHFPAPIALPANKRFFIGLSAPGYGGTGGDTLAQLYTQQKATGGTIWTDVPGPWTRVDQAFTANSQPLHLNGWKYIGITQFPVTANMNPDSTVVCEGTAVNFSATGSTGAASYQWSFNGGTISTSTSATPSVTFPTAGTYTQRLDAFNQCGFWDPHFGDVYVNANPSVGITSTADTVCPNNSATLTASGATSYNWTPGGAVNPLNTGALTATTSYTVTGTDAATGCTDIQNYTVYVANTPSAAFNATPTTVCTNMPITFNGTLSSDATSYSWNFTGGTPATSNIPTPTVTYASPGTYPVFLTATNSCDNDTLTGWVTITVCAGVNEISWDKGVTSVFDGASTLDVLVNDVEMGNYSIMVMNTMGQVVIREDVNINQKLYKKSYNLDHLSSGAYIVSIIGEKVKYSDKFVKY